LGSEACSTREVGKELLSLSLVVVFEPSLNPLFQAELLADVTGADIALLVHNPEFDYNLQWYSKTIQNTPDCAIVIDDIATQWRFITKARAASFEEKMQAILAQKNALAANATSPPPIDSTIASVTPKTVAPASRPLPSPITSAASGTTFQTVSDIDMTDNLPTSVKAFLAKFNVDRKYYLLIETIALKHARESWRAEFENLQMPGLTAVDYIVLELGMLREFKRN